ncbi:hypothetical protein MMC30_001684 [Trapelia coarctata]|nr:hypothetical protein [Trapelia coarctata]
MPFVVPFHTDPIILAGSDTADLFRISSNKKDVTECQPIGRPEPGYHKPLPQYLRDFDHHQHFLVHAGKDVNFRVLDTADNLKSWEGHWKNLGNTTKKAFGPKI